MIPTDFVGSNHVLDKPSGMNRDQCGPLNVRIENLEPDNIPVVISCWKFTHEELEAVNRTGRLFVVVAGTTMPPILLSAFPLTIEGSTP